VKRIYKVRFIDDGDERTMEAVLRGILRAKEEMRPKAKPLSAEAIINLQEPDTNCWFDSSPRGRMRQIRRNAQRIADRHHASRTRAVEKHYGPGPHPGTGTPQTIHAGDRAIVSEEAIAQAGGKAIPYAGNVIGGAVEVEEQQAVEEQVETPRLPSSLSALRAWIDPRLNIEEDDATACQEFIEDYDAGKWQGLGNAEDDRNPSAIADMFKGDLEDSRSSGDGGEPDYEAMRQDYEDAVTLAKDEALADVDRTVNAFDGVSFEHIATTLGLTEEQVNAGDDEGRLSEWYQAYATAQVMNSRYGENITWFDLQDEGPVALENQLLEMASSSVPEPDASDYQPDESDMVLDFGNAEEGQRV